MSNLADGNYTISYSVLSSDGHPVKGSYLISIGEGSSGKRAITIGNKNSINDQKSMLTSALSIFYYLSLLFVTGWMWWGAVIRKQLVETKELRRSYQKWALSLQCSFLLANVGMGGVLGTELLDHWDFTQIAALLTGTTIGISWVISLLLSVVGFVCLLRHPWLDRGWSFLVLAAKSVNGHAMAFTPFLLTASLDLVHLITAAIWAGGLLFLLFYYKNDQKNLWSFLVKFSNGALISIILLMITGITLTIIYLPKLLYLRFTQWGVLLIIKVVLVFFVIIVGGFSRALIKKNHINNLKKLVKFDFVLMIAIVGIVGIFTHLSPLPQNQPLLWHENGKNVDFTASISPNIPGTNMFMVEANSRETGVNIKRIELFLINNDNADVAPIRVPLTEFEKGKHAHYMIDGPYLSFTGNWTAEIRILDSEDNEKVYQKDFNVY